MTVEDTGTKSENFVFFKNSHKMCNPELFQNLQHPSLPPRVSLKFVKPFFQLKYDDLTRLLTDLRVVF